MHHVRHRAIPQRLTTPSAREGSAVVVVNRAIQGIRVRSSRSKTSMRSYPSNPTGVVAARRPERETISRHFVIKSSRFHPSRRW